MNNGSRSHPFFERNRGILYTVAGVLCAMCFVMSDKGYVGKSKPPASATSYLWCALAVCFALLFDHVFRRLRVRLSALQVIFGLFFGFINLLGTTLFAYDSWRMLKDPMQLILTLLKALGQALPMMAIFGWISHLLEDGPCVHRPCGEGEENAAEKRRIARRIGKHEAFALWLILRLCWLPYVIVYYPGSVCWDLGEAAQMFFGMRPMNAWHGVLATWLFGGCVWLGRLVGSDNLGVLLYTLVQLFLLAHMAAQMMIFLRKRGLNQRFCLMVFLFFAITPIWGGYVQFVGKDTLYVAALGLFLVRCAEALLCRDESAAVPFSLWRCVETFLYGLLACTIRTNGLVIVLPMAALMALFGWKREQRVHRRNRLRAAIAGLCAALVAMGFGYGLVPALGIVDDTGSAIHSPLFQQSARVLRDHPLTVTQEEFDAIDRVLDASKLSSVYEPWISDPVKYTFRYYGYDEKVQQQALAQYRKVWLAMARKYSLTYAEAFFAGNVSYYCFTPKLEGVTYHSQAGMRFVLENSIHQMGDDPLLVHVKETMPQEIRWKVSDWILNWRSIPLLGLLYCCAFYTWTLVGAALSLVRQKRWLALCLFAPALLCLITCCVSPVNDYFRYFLPIVAMTPLLVGVSVRMEE